MNKKTVAILSLVLILAVNNLASSANVIKTEVVTVSVAQQHKSVRPGTDSALAIHFKLKKDWHFYASPKNAPGGMNVKLKPAAEKHISFAEPILPQSQLYFDKTTNQKVDVFSDTFTVFLPFSVAKLDLINDKPITVSVKIGIEGAVCSDIQCRAPKFGHLTTEVTIAPDAEMAKPEFALPDKTQIAPTAKPSVKSQWGSYSAWVAFGLAFLAGLALNIMPCVLPVIPLKVLSIFEQAKESKARCIAMGLSFCGGILLFFAALAIFNIILRIGYGTVLQWGDHFRNPIFIVAMAVLMVVLALFMFGLFTFTVPSAIARKDSQRKGLAGSVAMGLLAAVLSTPCSFAILTAVFAWAQTQRLTLATITIMLIGLGMAAPYAILTSMPGLLKYLPRAGRWTELFKQAMGFVLLIVAVWLIAALPAVHKEGILYFAVILAFSIWMWVSWVTLTTPILKKTVLRLIAAIIAITSAMWLLPAQKTTAIHWQSYDPALIEIAREDRPVLIEFMAEWCLTCKAVEKTVYSRKDIARLIEQKGVLPIKADTTLADNQATMDLKQIYNEPGIPVSILFIPTQKQPIRLRGLVIGAKLKKLLQALPDKI